MDLLLVSLVLHSLSVLPLLFHGSQAEESPISKYSEYLNAKDVKEDMKRRRKQARIQPISLKPPPQDWPEPQMAPGDFIVTGQSEATSLSPLLMYQAKLEKEYAKQRQATLDGELKEKGTDNTKITREFTSSEEDFKRLLDPDELLRHNKQLRPYVNQGKTTGDQVEPQGKVAKLAGISSLTALKAKTSAKKLREVTKSVASSATTTSKPRRGRRKITTQKKLSENHSSLEEPKRKTSFQLGSESIKPRKRRKRVRGFTFAERKYEEIHKTSTSAKKFQTKAETVEKYGLKPEPTTILVENTPTSTENITLKATYITSTTRKMDVERRIKTAKISSKEIATSKTETMSKFTSISTPVEDLSNSIKYNSSCRMTSETVPRTTEVPTSSLTTVTLITADNKRNEIREKRKEMKQEMEKVLEAEELEGSFEDSDTDWTTSEKRKIPLVHVTPRHALMGVLKHKVISYIDKILRGSSKLREKKYPEDDTHARISNIKNNATSS